MDPLAAYRAYKEEIDTAIAEVLNSGHYVLGSTVKKFEEEFAEYVGVKHAIGVANGTDALKLSLMALDIGPGDEVITTPFTFIATATSIALIGARPVFVDIDPETLCIDSSKIAAAITPRTRAILPVHLFGQRAVLEDFGLPVIEDAAHSIGGRGRIATTSFYPTKPLACFGDGGAIMTDDDELAHKLHLLRCHGSERRDEHPLLGMNSRLDALQAAILRVQLSHLDEQLDRRRVIAKRYTEALSECCITPAEGWSYYTIRSSQRDHLRESLAERGISSFVYYSRCCHQQPIFADLGGDFPVAERAAQEVLSLPLHPWMTDEDVERVITGVREALLTAKGV